jgi:F-type H+-transporting ATPase subunit a
MTRKITFFLFISFFLLVKQALASGYVPAENDSISPAGENQLKHEGEEAFNPGVMIMEHIGDLHEWHIVTIKNKHFAIPLPVILYDEGKIRIFSSARFHHGTVSYDGYKLENEGANKGKIIKVLPDGITPDTSASLPIDLSITKNVLSLFIGIIILCWIFLSVARSYKKQRGHAPKGLQSLMEPLILFVRDDIALPSIGAKRYEKFMPFLLTLFFFIFINNLLGLVPFFPGNANLTGNIAVTMVLALITFFVTNLTANKAYWKHIINTPGVPWWLKFPLPLMPIVEIMSIFTKPFVLMIRLFANITAGHIIVLGFISLVFIFGNMNIYLGYGISIISVLFAVFMGLLELLVAFLQAYVFTLLSALYFGMSQVEEHHEEHKH